MTPPTRDLAAEIERYCAAHRDARDTLEGIAWWLTMQRCSETLEELRSAVNALVDQRVLVAYHLNDGTTVYGCAAVSEGNTRLGGDEEQRP